MVVPSSNIGRSQRSNGRSLSWRVTPARLRRRQEVVVLLEPEVEIPVRVEPFYRLPEKPFQPPEILVNFGQFLPGVGEEILDLQLGMMLPHVDGKGRTVAAA